MMAEFSKNEERHHMHKRFERPNKPFAWGIGSYKKHFFLIITTQKSEKLQIHDFLEPIRKLET